MAETTAVGAQLGPRIIGRLTPELILRSPQYMNPCNQYEIDLRASRIAAIENLGATEVRGRPAPRPPRRRHRRSPLRLCRGRAQLACTARTAAPCRTSSTA